MEDHPTARITGAPKLFEGRLYVPVASSEEGAGAIRDIRCCTFRGSVVALDAATGKQIWKTYVDYRSAAANRPNRWGPAGGGVWSSPTIDPKRHVLYANGRCLHRTRAENHRLDRGDGSGHGQD